MKTFKEFLNNLDESEMGELHANIKSHFEDKHDVEIGKPLTHYHKNYKNNREYVVHPVTYYDKPETHRTKYGLDKRQQFQTYVHQDVNSTNVHYVHKGLPKKLGGDQVSIK